MRFSLTKGIHPDWGQIDLLCALAAVRNPPSKIAYIGGYSQLGEAPSSGKA
jgi:hypothetical protein